MSLLSKIPGLSRHQARDVDQPLPMDVPPSRFDRLWADRMMANALAEVDAAYSPGALAWLADNRPDVSAFLREATHEVCNAVLAEDGPRVTTAVERFVEAHKRAFKIFEARPSIIEVDSQLELLAAVG